jgi:hypothetical protein
VDVIEITAFQIHDRTMNYLRLFERNGAHVRLQRLEGILC